MLTVLEILQDQLQLFRLVVLHLIVIPGPMVATQLLFQTLLRVYIL